MNSYNRRSQQLPEPQSLLVETLELVRQSRERLQYAENLAAQLDQRNKKRIQNIEDEAAYLKKQLEASFVGVREELQAGIDDLKTQKAQDEAAAKESQRFLDELHDEIKRTDEQLSSLRNDKASLLSVLEKANTQLLEKAVRLKQLENDSDRLSSDIAARVEEKAVFERELDVIRTDYESKMDDMRKKQAKLGESTKKTTKELQNVSDELAEAKKQLEATITQDEEYRQGWSDMAFRLQKREDVIKLREAKAGKREDKVKRREDFMSL